MELLLKLLWLLLMLFGSGEPQAASVVDCTTSTDWQVGYTVQAGDTLASIATRSNTTIEELASANCITDINVIPVGQTLLVPQFVSPDSSVCAYEIYISNMCPYTQRTENVAFQSFEHGTMYWFGTNNQILILYHDGTYAYFADTWNGQALAGENPPAGYYQPQRGFGYLWQNNVDVRNRLGWALVEIESYYMAQIEITYGETWSRYDGSTFILLPDARVARLSYPDIWVYE